MEKMSQLIRFSAVIFDMDGLMFDTENIALKAWHRAMKKFGYILQKDIYLETIGKSVQDRENTFRKVFGPKIPFYEVRKLKQVYFEEYIEKQGIPTKPGLFELLDFIDAARLMKAVASSTEKKLVVEKLDRAGLIDRFNAIVGGDEVENGKPAPDIFLVAAEQLNVPVELCVVLEDSDSGIRAAHTAGMLPIIVPDIGQLSKEAKMLAYKNFSSLYEVKSFFQDCLTLLD